MFDHLSNSALTSTQLVARRLRLVNIVFGPAPLNAAKRERAQRATRAIGRINVELYKRGDLVTPKYKD
jgi:hypothetical protein